MLLDTQKKQSSIHPEGFMAQELQSINLVAPAFKGINTEDSALAQDPSFAEVADNAVIDQRGRIAARKGLSVVTTDKTELGSGKIRAIKEFKNESGETKVFSVGNNKILSGTTTLADETPVSYSISANDWKMVNFNNSIYFFQRGYAPLIYNTIAAIDSGGAGSVVKVLSTVDSASGLGDSTKFGNEVLAAYGRLWTADFATDKSTIYWSDLLSGHKWTGGSSGSINIAKVWPDGFDEIVSLKAHNNFLIIFGKSSIVVYSGADDPANMALSDTLGGVGCVGRDTVQHTGQDVLFLSHTGLKSFGRTVQENSMPVNSLSGTITKDIIALLTVETESFKSVYHPEENFYLITFTNQDVTYCFDIRGTLENGSYRATRWPGTTFTSYVRQDNGTLLIGSSLGLGTYSGYQDNSLAYRFKYSSPELSFGDASKIKFLKKIRPTIVGGSGSLVFLSWTYDFKEASGNTTYTLSTQSTAEYNVDEFNVGQFSTGEFTSRIPVNTSGSGGTLAINMEADIDGKELSLQEINVLALMGKTI
jgi:hypothetical protein